MAEPRFGLDGTTSSGEQYARDLKRAAGFKPITQQDLEGAYKQYDQKPGQVKASHSDVYLYKRATSTVISWWKNQKAEEAKKAAAKAQQPPAATGTKTPTSSGGGSGSSKGGSATGSQASGNASGGYSGPMLPNTSVSAKASSVPKLKPIPRPISATYVSSMLTRYGFAGIKPPAYALKNKDTFDQWLGRAIRYRQLTQSQATRVTSAPAKAVPTTRGTTGGARLV